MTETQKQPVELTPTEICINEVKELINKVTPTLINYKVWRASPQSRMALVKLGRLHVDIVGNEWVTGDKEITAWLNIIKQGKWCDKNDPEFEVHLARLVPFDTYNSVLKYLATQKEVK